MSAEITPEELEYFYRRSAVEYSRRLTPEHPMEATSQATQRKTTLVSLDLVQVRRPDIHVFNELLIQYPRRGRRQDGRVVPDNMVVIHPSTIEAGGSYDLPSQPARPFWVLDYASRSSERAEGLRKEC